MKGQGGRDPVAEAYGRLLGQLEGAGRIYGRSLLGRRLAEVAGIGFPLVGLLAAANLLFPAASRALSASLGFVLVAAALVAVLSGARLLAPRAPREIARLLERRLAGPGEAALSAVELWELRAGTREGYSPELVDEAILRRARGLAGADLVSPLRMAAARGWMGAAGGGLALLVAVVVASPGAAGRLAGGMLGAGGRSSGSASGTIEVRPGDCRVLAGDSLALSARWVGPEESEGARPALTVEVQYASGEPAVAARFPMVPAPAGGDEPADGESAAGESAAGESAAGSASYHRYTFPRVLRAFDYRVLAAGPGAASPHYRVTLAERPRVVGIDLTYHPPAYTRLPERRVETGDGGITALRGTRVEIAARANVPLAEARLVVETAAAGESPAARDTVRLAVAGERGPEAALARGQILVNENARYRLELASRDGFASLPEEPRAVVALDDEYPLVRLVKPGADVTLGNDLQLALTVSAVDDYGLASAVLHYRLALAAASAEEPEKEGSVNLLPPARGEETRRDLLLEHAWELGALGLGPGDAVSYWITVADNDAVRGPKEAQTPVYQARFPGLEEIYADMAEEGAEQQQNLEELAAEARDLRERVEELSREAQQKPDLSWEQRQEAAAALERQQELHSRLGEVIESLQQTAETAQDRDLLSPEAISKIMELQDLLQQVATPELIAAMQQLRERMAQVSPEEMAAAMKQLSLSQEELLQRLDRAIALLKRYQQEQRLEELVSRAEELLERQDEILAELDRAADAAEMSPLATREERVAADTEKLAEAAEALAEELRAAEPATAEALDSATTGLEAEEVPQDLAASSQAMAVGKKAPAQERGARARGGQQNFRDRLAMAQSQFTEGLRQEVMRELRLAAQEVLSLSLAEETLVGRLEADPGDRRLARELADDQQDLLGGLTQATDRLMRLGEKTMLIGPQLARSLGEGLARLREAVGELAEGRAGTASQRGDRAVVAMNETVVELRKAEQQASSCESGTGVPQMCDRLQAASCQQAGLNQGTQTLHSQLGNEPGGRLSDEARAAMSRLAAEQRAISEALGDAMRDAAGESQVLGRLDRTLDEMRETAQELADGRLSQQTLDRQERILSRLLDAQRSARRRDYSQRRMSRPGELTSIPASPAPLPASIGQPSREVREDLLRSVSERYPPEYEPLIRDYFRALWREEEK